jgi:homocysteine S-methyltransferase
VPIDASLETALARGPVVIDGGLSNQLETAGHDLSDELWTARLLRDDPSAIVDAHSAYFAAGASVVLTASYQVGFAGFARHGIPAEETAKLLHRSVSLAQTARDRYAGPARPLWIAASVGPYGATLADGSEYRGRYGLTATQLHDFHRPRLEVLAEAGPDLFAIETVPDLEEAEVLVRIAAELDIPVWLSYTVAGTSTRAGQPLGEAFALAAGVPQVIATGINCSAPDDVPAAIALATEATGKPVVVYPNSGEVWDAGARRWTGRASLAPEDVRSWVGAGARLIGGCCRVGAGEIAELAAAVATR